MWHLSFLLFSCSTAGNGYSTGRQCAYSVAPINSCKSLLSAFAEGNLLFQIHEAALHVKGKHLKATRLPVNTRARFTWNMQSAYLCQRVYSLHMWHCRAKGGAHCRCLLCLKWKLCRDVISACPAGGIVAGFRVKRAQLSWRDASSLLFWGLTQLSQISCCSVRIRT